MLRVREKTTLSSGFGCSCGNQWRLLAMIIDLAGMGVDQLGISITTETCLGRNGEEVGHGLRTW